MGCSPKCSISVQWYNNRIITTNHFMLQILGAWLRVQSSTQGLVRELHERGEAAGANVLCPVPHVAAPLKEPPVVPRCASKSSTHFHTR